MFNTLTRHRPALLIALLASFVFTTTGASANICGKSFRLEGQLKLDATPDTALPLDKRATFSETDFPQWVHPYNSPLRGTGWTATSCRESGGSPIVVQDYSPTGDTYTPGNSVVVNLNPLCVPAYGGKYDVDARMRLGHPFTWNHPDEPIAEDFYVFARQQTHCVGYCATDGCPPPGVGEGECLPDGPINDACNCDEAPGCAAPDCDNPSTCPAGPGVYTHPQIRWEDDFGESTERVAFLDVRFGIGGLPNEGDLPPECTSLWWTNPLAARVYVDMWTVVGEDEFGNPIEGWKRRKAGTEFFPGTAGPWINEDNCMPNRPFYPGHGPDTPPPWDPLCTDLGFPEPTPLPRQWTDPRIPVYFAIPAGERLRIHGTVRFNTCQGAADIDIVDFLWPEDDYPATTYREHGIWYHDITDRRESELGAGNGAFKQGEWGQEFHEIIQDVREESRLITKICGVDCEQPPEKNSHEWETGHSNSCCGPEWGGLHGEMNMLDTRGCGREFTVQKYDFTLHALKEHRVEKHVDRTTASPAGGLFRCLNIQPYDQDPSTPPPLFEDPTCLGHDCPQYGPGAPFCNVDDEFQGEWRFSLAAELPQPNYFEPGREWFIYHGDWYRTGSFFMNMQEGKNRIWMAPIEGLHGLLMADDPALCGDGVGLADIIDEDTPRHRWDGDRDFPNYHDLDISRFAPGGAPGNPCWSEGVYATNQPRMSLREQLDELVEVPTAADAFKICDPEDSMYGTLEDRYGEPHFIRVRDYDGPDSENDPPVHPTFVPDRTYCSEYASVRGVLRLIDGSSDPFTGAVKEIGLENSWTLRRHGGPGGTPPDDWSEDHCSQDYDLLWRNPSTVVTRPYHESVYSTSNGAGPQGQTVFQYLWPHGPELDTTRPFQCGGDQLSGCLCGDPALGTDYFGMDRLIDPRDPSLLSELISSYGLPDPGADVDDFEDSTTEFHYDNIVGLTNNVKATASTRTLFLEFHNEKFVSGLDGLEAPVNGGVILFDATKPIQDHGSRALTGAGLPAQFHEPANLDTWPYITKVLHGATDVDSEVDARTGLDPADPWCDSTHQTDPPVSPPVRDYPDTAAGCPQTNGRTLVDRYTLWPGDCKVENFGACMGEVRFEFVDVDLQDGDILHVQGNGYFNAVVDSDKTWAIPSTRPDLVGVDLDGIPGDEAPFIDLNDDNVPDQQVMSFHFTRPDGWTVGDDNMVVGFVPAGVYSISGWVERDGGKLGQIPVDNLPIACGELTVVAPYLTVTSSSDCNQTGVEIVKGDVYAPPGCTLIDDEVRWTNHITGATDVVTLDTTGARGNYLGSYEAHVPLTRTVDIPGVDPYWGYDLGRGCNDIQIEGFFTGDCGGDPYDTERFVIIYDDRKPFIHGSNDSPHFETVYVGDDCTAPITYTATVNERCSDGPCHGADYGPRLLAEFKARLVDSSGGEEEILCDVSDAAHACDPPDSTGFCYLTCEVTFEDKECGVYEMFWEAKDQSGLEALREMKIVFSVEDDTDPVWTSFPADQVVECGDCTDPSMDPKSDCPDYPTADENCGPATIDYVDDVHDYDECVEPDRYVKKITRTWTAKGTCGSETSRVQVIYVADREAPVLHGLPDEDEVILACGDDLPDIPEVTAEDACEGEVDVVFVQDPPEPILHCDVITRTWTATDRCGNLATFVQTIRVEDDEPPTLDGAVSVCGIVSRPPGECPACYCYDIEEMFQRSFCSDLPWTLDFEDNCPLGQYDCTPGTPDTCPAFTDDTGMALCDPPILKDIDVHTVFTPPYPGGQAFPPQGGCTNPFAPLSWTPGSPDVCVRYPYLDMLYSGPIVTHINATVTVEYKPCPDQPPVEVTFGPRDFTFVVPRTCMDCMPMLGLPPHEPMEPCTGCP